MMQALRTPLATWALLIVATLLSYLSWIDPALLDPLVAGSLVIVIAMFKAWLIGMRFMELGRAILWLRLAYTAWVMVVGGVLLTMFALA